DLSEDQQMMRDTFARFLDENSSMARVRAALPGGFDPALWTGRAELWAFSIRVPEASGGLDLGLLEATVLMEEGGRTLSSVSVAETLVAARLLANLGGSETSALLERVTTGECVATLAFHDLATQPVQWVAGGSVAEVVIARHGDEIVLISIPESSRTSEANLASTPLAELHLADGARTTLGAGPQAGAAFAQAVEEWKLLIGAALSGLSREAVRLAAAYACERS